MHAAQFPVSTPMMILWAVLLLAGVFLFIHFLNLQLRKNRRNVILAVFGLLLIGGAAVHVVMLSLSTHTATDGNWIQLCLISLVAGLEMFVGRTFIFDDIYAAVVFHMPGLLLAYLTIFTLILCFSFVMVFQILPRKFRDRIWLRTHGKKAAEAGKNHIFLGINPQTKALARSILKEDDRDGRLILIDFPDREQVHKEISLGDVLSNLMSRRKEKTLEEELGSDRFVLLKGLQTARLAPWLNNPRTSIYLLSEDEDENMERLEMISGAGDIPAKIFCLVDRKNGFNGLYSGLQNRIRLIDTHYLAFQDIKFNRPDLHPVHFVDIARGKDGCPLGYVKDGFHAMIVGFGETGQEALGFLYEFGTFVGKDRNRIPLSISVYDPDMDLRKGQYLGTHPGLRDDPSLKWSDAKVGSERFWEDFVRDIRDINYIIVATNSDSFNIETAVSLLQSAAREGKDLSEFVILAREKAPSEASRSILDYYNRSYCPDGRPVICSFGGWDRIWQPDVISGKGLKEQASRFFDAYQRATGQSGSWDERRDALMADPANRLRNNMELMRKQGHELECCAHVHTKLQLASPEVREAARLIPDVLEPGQTELYPERGKIYDSLEYLAIGENLRKCASLLVSGYRKGEKDELRQRTLNLRSYEENGELYRHFDWITVKTSLL